MEAISLIIFGVILLIVYVFWNRSTNNTSSRSGRSGNGSNLYPNLSNMQNNSLHKMFGTGKNFPNLLLYILHLVLIFIDFKTLGQEGNAKVF